MTDPRPDLPLTYSGPTHFWPDPRAGPKVDPGQNGSAWPIEDTNLHHRTRPEAESRQFTFAKLLSSTARGGELELTVAKSGKVLLVSLDFASFIAASDFMLLYSGYSVWN